MHRQHEHRALIPGLVEFIDPYLGNFPRRSVVRALHVEERRIVQDPLDRYFDDSRWLAVLQELIRAVVGHHRARSEEHTSELQSLAYLVCRLLLEKKKTKEIYIYH